MEFSGVKEWNIPEGKVSGVSVGGTEIWRGKQYPKKGDLIDLDINGDGVNERYRVIKKISSNIAELLSLTSVGRLAMNNIIYENNTVDTYLNTTWYNGLPNTTKNAIVDKSFKQEFWLKDDTGYPVYTGNASSSGILSLDSTRYGNEITRHIYVIGVQDILDYILDRSVTDGKFTRSNISNMFVGTGGVSRHIQLNSGFTYSSATTSGMVLSYNLNLAIDHYSVYNSYVIRPAFQIDLSKIDYSIEE